MAQPIDLTISDDEDGPRPCRTSLRVHKGGALPLTNAVVDLTCISSECTEEEQPAKRARPAGSTTVDEATPLRAREERERAASLTTPFCKLPPPDTLDPFMLLHTNADPRGAAHTTTLEALFDGEWSWAVLSNYTMRTRWLQRACASILDARCPLILLAPEGKDVELAAWAAEQPSVCLVHPKVEKFGTHHAKFALLFCAAGLRVVVHTSNYLENEVRNMTQGVWWQDFPRRPASAARPAPTRDALGQFGSTLHAYLRRVLATPIKLTTAGGERAIAGADALLDFDFDAAGAHLLASVPGKHAGAEMERWGHPQLAALVRAEPATSALLGQSRAAMSEVCASDELVLQFSSFSSVSRGGADERCLWLWELCSSLSANPQSARLPPRLLTAHIVWPTRDEVRDCHIGWKGGGAIPALRDNVEKVLRDPVARRCLRRWTSPCHQLGRASVTAHLKSYVRFDPVSKRVAWLAMTSSNLSKAAWGEQDAWGKQLYIKSYEVGVLITPSTLANARSRPRFNCQAISSAPGGEPPSPPPAPGALPGAPSAIAMVPVHEAATVPTAGALLAAGAAALPLPYALLPPPYDQQDVPWMSNVHKGEQDAWGNEH
ncbi:hypothetical protein KFE25_011038 [Diacronema lutheri]|uniref:Tyrosyl-DNA phosphodiesterase 1 n=1 Tax=Diacronema lutheri TaxID=2081491 RepID=A0A8J5X9Q7_DIALT|nr:hypothetical protein KFE25_011038 [Diacronema lutheri]